MMGVAVEEAREAAPACSDEGIAIGTEIERDVDPFTMFSNDNCFIAKDFGDEMLPDTGALTGVPGFELERAAFAAASISANEGDDATPTGDKSEVAEGVPAEEFDD